MLKSLAKKEYKKKIKQYKKHSKKYFEDSSPIVSDRDFDLLKKEVSGELRYLGSPSSMILPPMAIKSPFIFLMGKITLPLNRS